MLILLYVGAVETGNLLTMYRRTSQVATTAADLTAQVKSVLTSDLSDVTSAASSIMTPYSTAPLNIVISSVVANQNNAGKVAWSYGSKGGARVQHDGVLQPRRVRHQAHILRPADQEPHRH